MYSLYVGIDISKDSFSATGIDGSEKTIFSFTANMDKEGFDKLLANIHDKSIIAMESTACYHINLFSFLTEKNFNTVIINPFLISNFAKLSLRKTKTDKKDSKTIARFLLLHKDSISQILISQDTRDLRDIARERESMCKLITSHKNEIKRILQSTFPELTGMVNVFSNTILNFLLVFPSAHLIRIAKPEDIVHALTSAKGRRVSVSADEMIATANSSIASVSPAKESILPQKISTLLHLIEKLEYYTNMLATLCKSMVVEELKIITSIDGIDTTTGAAFLAEIGKIDNFDSHKKLIAFAGIDPSTYQSGKFYGESKISKRGNRHLRRLIYLMAVNVIRYNRVFKAYFDKRKHDGLPYRKAVMATAHKLMRVIFYLLSHKTLFSYDKLSS